MISLQTYAVQTALEADLRGTLGVLADAGFTQLEAGFGFGPDEIRIAKQEFGFSVPAALLTFSSPQLTVPGGGIVNIPDPAEAFRTLAAAGVGLVIDPYVSPDEWLCEQSIDAIAARINARAVEAAAYGLQVGYHNHGHEISTKIGGRTALEVLADRLDPRIVLELDLYWAAYGGADVPELVTALGERLVAVHVKDGRLSVPDPLSQQTPAGQGDVPLIAALKAATHLQYAAIEFDQPYHGDAVEASILSRQFLVDHGLG